MVGENTLLMYLGGVQMSTARLLTGCSLVYLTLCFVLAGCVRTARPGLAEAEPVPLFTDGSVDGVELAVAGRLETLLSSEEAELAPMTELASLPTATGDFQAQAVLPGTSGFVYYIQYNPNSTVDPYRVYRYDQYSDVRTLVYGGKREVQAVAGSYDGNFLVLSMRQTTTTPNDFEIFRFNILSQTAQRLTDNTVDDTNVSMSGNSLSVVWEAPVSGVAKIFFRKYTSVTATTGFTESILVSADAQRQPSLSASGLYLALVRDLANGKDQVFRFSLSSNVYAGISSQSLSPLEHPSISNTGKQIAWLQNDVSSDQIMVRNTAAGTIQTVVGPLETLEHPFISADGQYLTYGKIDSSTLKVFVKELLSGFELQLTNPLAPVSNKGMIWQMPFVSGVKIVSSDGAPGDQFGYATATSGDFIVVGAPFDNYDIDSNGTAEADVGSAYLLRRQGGSWAIFKKLVPSDGAVQDFFGFSVAMSGDTVIVGAIAKVRDTNADGVAEPSVGVAYVFQRNLGGTDNWGQVTKLIASDAASADNFGRSVAISNDTILVGAPGKDFDTNGNGVINCNSTPRECDLGSVYVFQRDQGGPNQWGEIRKLSSSTGLLFGNDLAIAGDTAIVGSYAENRDINGDGIVEFGLGAAYIFEQNLGGTNNWGERKKLTASDGEENELFGYSVAIAGDTVVIGVPNENHYPETNRNGGCWYSEEDRIEDGCNVGAAYVFERNQGGTNQWGEVKKLIASDDYQGGGFGGAVAISRDLVVVSSPSAKAIYHFQRSLYGRGLWEETKKLLPVDAPTASSFGVRMALGTVLSVGSPFDTNGKGTNAGAIYIYEQ